MEPNTESWPVIYQIWASIGAAVVGAVMWLLGRKPRPDRHDTREAREREHERLAELVRELDRAETTADLAALRADIQQIIAAGRDGMFNKIAESCEKIVASVDELTKRVARLELDYARLEMRLRSRRNPET